MKENIVFATPTIITDSIIVMLRFRLNDFDYII